MNIAAHDDASTSRRTRRQERLLRRYHELGDERARDELVEELMPLARALAARYSGGREPMDDLVQVACLGIVKAIAAFDLSRDVQFSSYAVPTVLGELRRYFRDRSWTIRPPRGLQELHLRVGRTRETLTERLGRPPSVQELASAVQVSVEEILEALQVADARQPHSLQEPAGEDVTLGDAIGRIDQGLELAEIRVLLAGAVGRLGDREREILRLRFEEDLTQTEIAARIGVSQMQISRLIRASLAQLRASLGDAGGARAAA